MSREVVAAAMATTRALAHRDEAAGGVEGEAGGSAEEEGLARRRYGPPVGVWHVPQVEGWLRRQSYIMIIIIMVVMMIMRRRRRRREIETEV